MDAHAATLRQRHLDASMDALRAGAPDQARQHLLAVLRTDPRHETAWLWLSAVQPTTDRALRCLEHLLTINPEHAQAKERRDVLRIQVLLEEAAITPARVQAPSTGRRRALLGEALVEAGVLTAWQLDQALRYQAYHARPTQREGLGKLLGEQCARPTPPKRLGEILMELGMIHSDHVALALMRQAERATGALTPTGVGRLGDFLVRQGLLTQDHLQHALTWQAQQHQAGTALRLGEVLIQCGYLNQEQVTQAVQQWYQEYELAWD
jgi:hypothetical protein